MRAAIFPDSRLDVARHIAVKSWGPLGQRKGGVLAVCSGEYHFTSTLP
jgi:hypothetical protein